VCAGKNGPGRPAPARNARIAIGFISHWQDCDRRSEIGPALSRTWTNRDRAHRRSDCTARKNDLPRTGGRYSLRMREHATARGSSCSQRRPRPPRPRPRPPRPRPLPPRTPRPRPLRPQYHQPLVPGKWHQPRPLPLWAAAGVAVAVSANPETARVLKP
jgi:hypothetical protein